MTRLRPSAIAFLAIVSGIGTLGCEKKPKPEETQKSEPTPVPSGIVFNDFLPASGGATGIGVRDTGGDGGLGAIAAGEEAPAAAGEGGKLTVKLLEPGAEPRAARKYAFVANKTEKRVLTITQSISQSGAGQAMPPQEITMKLHLELTPKQVKPTGATVELKLAKVELPGAPPQVASMLAAMNGFSGTFELSSHGEAGEASFAPTQGMQANPQLAQQIVESLSRGIELLLAPLPAEPVGAGAKWEIATKGQDDQGAKRFTLREVTNEGGVVDSDIEMKIPRRATPAPRGGGTMFVEVDSKGHYTQQLRFNQISPKAEGELTENQKIEVGGEGKGGQKQTVLVTQKAKQIIETPGAGK